MEELEENSEKFLEGITYNDEPAVRVRVEQVGGIGEFRLAGAKLGDEKVEICWKKVQEPASFGDELAEKDEEKAFLVVRKNTLEVRCDRKLSGLLREKYESVMESRYFGRGGIELVDSGQLGVDEIEDLARLSYNLSV